MVGNPPANAGDTGSSPGPGGSHILQSNWAHAPQLLSLRSRAREPQVLSPHAATTEAHEPGAHAPQQWGVHHGEKPAHRGEEWPLLAATRGSPYAAMKTQHSQK